MLWKYSSLLFEAIQFYSEVWHKHVYKEMKILSSEQDLNVVKYIKDMTTHQTTERQQWIVVHSFQPLSPAKMQWKKQTEFDQVTNLIWLWHSFKDSLNSGFEILINACLCIFFFCLVFYSILLILFVWYNLKHERITLASKHCHSSVL